MGHHMIKSRCSTQQIVAFSSGEAELYAPTKGARPTKGIISMLVDFDLNLDGKVCMDASAAIGISNRRGLGRTRHLDVQYLWIQDEITQGRLKLVEVGTKNSPAGTFTKVLPRDVMPKHSLELDIELGQTRATKAPEFV